MDKEYKTALFLFKREPPKRTCPGISSCRSSTFTNKRVNELEVITASICVTNNVSSSKFKKYNLVTFKKNYFRNFMFGSHNPPK